jgi:signal transduction histidine kinase
MKGALSRIGLFIDSLTGRVVLILTVGMAAASILSLLLAERARVQDFDHVRLDAMIASTADIFDRLARDPTSTAQLLHDNRIFGAREAPSQWLEMRPDPELGRMLAARLGRQSRPEAMLMPRDTCFPRLDLALRAAGNTEQSFPDCWYVRFRDAGGVERRLSVDLASIPVPPNSTLEPLYLLLIVGASAILSFLVARFATAPLWRLTQAARAFSVTVDPEPIPEHGPSEVRAALQTFNIMQNRVRDGFRERTQILASIAHDLQTPLTRLRLRLEHVSEEPLRHRLIADLAVMQQLVRDGLDLARSSESREPWSVVAIDSILSSIAEDAAEFGHAVRFVGGCGAHAQIKPNALVRCLNNLVDNAIKYAGDAELSCAFEGRDLVIHVRDHGRGITEQAVEEALQPFRRLERGLAPSNGGTGIGLAIARAQAQTFGATLALCNHADGGLLAIVRLRAA